MVDIHDVDRVTDDILLKHGIREKVVQVESPGFNKVTSIKKPMTKQRKYIMFFLIGLIIGSIAIIIYQGKDAFREVKILTYHDGCNETYINGKLNGSECASRNDTIKYKVPSLVDSGIILPSLNVS